MKKLISLYLRILIGIICFFAGTGFGLFYYYGHELPPLSELQHFDLKTGSEVYDKDDNLIHVFATEKRRLTDLSELPQYMKYGMISVEDRNFFKHWGVDLYGIARAFVIDITRMNFSQGASTITQQLARNLFLSLDRTIPRKIKEVLVSIQIEKHYSKDEILELYFNKVPFGPGLYGIEAASSKFFGKPAKDVTVAEAALIIGMTQLPSAYNPFRYPARAMRRRNIVLRSMLEENVIDLNQYAEAMETPLELYHPKGNWGADDYFIEHIRQKLEKKYGTNQLFAGGMKIYTSIDLDLTQYADSTLNKHLNKFAVNANYDTLFVDYPADTTDIETKYVQGGVYVIEPETGFVRVMIGGRNFNHNKFNRMLHARRQPGSAFKPILYTTALENNYTAATVIQDEPVMFVQSDTLYWEVHNYSRENYGYMRMRDALKKSRNIYATKMIYDIGPKKVVDYAKRFGLTTKIWPIYSLAIGTCEVVPAELISAYTTFPNGGVRTTPIYIRRVEDNQGHVLEEARPERIRVVDEKTAYIMASLMRSVVEEGTGVGIGWRGYKWNAAGKTGTTDDYRDAWFIGYNKKLVTGIWVGFDDNRPLGRRKTGANTALPPWPKIMIRAMENESPKNSKGKAIIDGAKYDFVKPDGIISIPISKETGLLPKNVADDTIIEDFISGTEPTPLSDSLNYNFYPTQYRENYLDTLVIDLGGRKVEIPDSLRVSLFRKRIIDHKTGTFRDSLYRDTTHVDTFNYKLFEDYEEEVEEATEENKDNSSVDETDDLYREDDGTLQDYIEAEDF